MALPLFQRTLPSIASSAYSTALVDRFTRSATLILLSPPRNSPLDTAKITPFTTIGASGDTISRADQPCSKAGLPSLFTIFQVTSLLPAAARIQRVPAKSCQLVKDPVGAAPDAGDCAT